LKICVSGLWHLGCVTAAGLAAAGHQVIGLDCEQARVAKLRRGIAPVSEPNLDRLIAQGLSSNRLQFSSTLSEATRNIDVFWVTHDTPIDDDDGADSDFVMAQIERELLGVNADTLVLISSQLPVGSIRRLEHSPALNGRPAPLRFAYSPENLRLGSAVNDFLHPQRIVVGIRSDRDRQALHTLLSPLCQRIEWMSVESAEMTKHAINAFLATSIAFANELALICETVGADPREVERGLKSENRIGPRAYLSAGAAFAGGTLGRDVAFLNQTSRRHGVTTPLLSSVLPSNDLHKHWARQKLAALRADLSQSTVAVWGLTYKPGTDTLRRSASVELCDWLISHGASIQVHDPLVNCLPERWGAAARRYDDPLAAVPGAQVLVLATDSPVYRAISSAQLLACVSNRLLVLDANRLLPHLADAGEHLEYFAVGTSIGDA